MVRLKSRSSSWLCTMPLRSMKALLHRGWISRKSYQEAMRLSSAKSFRFTTAWNSSPASQAEPMIRPSRCWLIRLLGMMG